MGAAASIERKAAAGGSLSGGAPIQPEMGTFRGDLLHRLGVVTLHVPPLRERPEDLTELIEMLAAGDGGPRARLLSRWHGPSAVPLLAGERARAQEPAPLRLRVQSCGAVTAEHVESLLNDPKTRTIFPRNLLGAETLASLRDRLDRDSRALCSFLGLGRRQLYRRCAPPGIRLREERQIPLFLSPATSTSRAPAR